jgi:hypothetical protein
MTTKNAPQIFTATGDGYDMTPAGVLLLAANTAYGHPAETTPEGHRNAALLIDGVLSAAAAGGYKECNLLRHMLTWNTPTTRLAMMVQAACEAAGEARIGAVFDRLGLSHLC